MNTYHLYYSYLVHILFAELNVQKLDVRWTMRSLLISLNAAIMVIEFYSEAWLLSHTCSVYYNNVGPVICMISIQWGPSPIQWVIICYYCSITTTSNEKSFQSMANIPGMTE